MIWDHKSPGLKEIHDEIVCNVCWESVEIALFKCSKIKQELLWYSDEPITAQQNNNNNNNKKTNYIVQSENSSGTQLVCYFGKGNLLHTIVVMLKKWSVFLSLPVFSRVCCAKEGRLCPPTETLYIVDRNCHLVVKIQLLFFLNKNWMT